MNWPQAQLKAKPHCCEEASLRSGSSYIPCDAPATNVVGWRNRTDKPIRMCDFCTDHNVKNRNGYIVRNYVAGTTWPVGEDTPWPKDVMEFDKAMAPSNPLDAMSEDQLLMLWDSKKKAIEVAKEEEMDLRKYIVGRAFPKKEEGMNTKELGQGYQLKAGIKYNYNLADNDTVENCLNRIAKVDNTGAFIVDRLVSWKPSFLLTEYRQLVEDKDKGSKSAEEILKIVNEMLTISEAAPSLEIKEPKAKKK
jgi:hypothetical protein